MSALYMIVGTLVGVLVTFHEFGHFWVARRCGVKVLRSPSASARRWCAGTTGTAPSSWWRPFRWAATSRCSTSARRKYRPICSNSPSIARRSVSGSPSSRLVLSPISYRRFCSSGSSPCSVASRCARSSVPWRRRAWAQAGLEAGQELLAVDGEPVTGWSGVNLQLVRRLGESGTLEVRAGKGLECRFHPPGASGWLAEGRGQSRSHRLAGHPALAAGRRRCWPNSTPRAGRRAEARRPLAEHRWHRRRRLAAGGG